MIIDGLQCGRYDRATLASMRDGGLGAVTVTVAFWENATETMDAIARWNDLAREHADLILLVRSSFDLDEAERSGRLGVILGAQNSSPFDDRLGFVEHFWHMGLRIAQLTYNNQNAIGSSCYEPVDGGLSRFGREIVTEMNRVGMIVDLSHVGDRTAVDAIEHSSRPVVVNHANAYEIYPHPRNKSRRVLDALVANGGVLGVCTYNNIAGPFSASAESIADLICRHVDLLGVDHVGLGTDLSPNVDDADFEWMRKGRWTRAPQPGAALSGVEPVPAEWLEDSGKLVTIRRLLIDTGRLAAEEAALVFGGNWARLYTEGFAPAR